MFPQERRCNSDSCGGCEGHQIAIRLSPELMLKVQELVHRGNELGTQPAKPPWST
jgi:hypothetical protein